MAGRGKFSGQSMTYRTLDASGIESALGKYLGRVALLNMFVGQTQHQ
jgi:hypothetical protein